MNHRLGLPWLCVFTLSGSVLSAQCALQWQSQGGYDGINGAVFASIEWDPDGAGPRSPVVVLGGTFGLAGTAAVANLASFDPATGAWSAFGSGFDGTVRALAVSATGDLIAGGSFQNAGGAASRGIARWNGAGWVGFGSGIAGGQYGIVNALVVLPNGDLVAAGDFSSISGVAANHIARWNGNSWSALATGVAWPGNPASVLSLAALPNGDVAAGGWFTVAGGAPAIGVAVWNGSAWSALGGSVNSAVHTILPMPNGDLIVGGQFGSAGGVTAIGVARWNGATWSSLGTGLRFGTGLGQAYSLARTPNGDVIATGGFTTAGGVAAGNIARWNGVTWSALGSGLAFGVGQTLVVRAAGPVLTGGQFTVAGGAPAGRVAQWSGTGWSPLTSGWNGAVRAFTTRSNGDLVAAGYFTSAAGVAANRVALWNGSWSPMGSGMDFVYALATTANGDVVAGGQFGLAGGVLANSVARWTGSAWSAMGTGLSGAVIALVTLPNGNIVAGGTFMNAGAVPVNGIARWDGSSWSPLGAGFNSHVWALAVMPNGDLIAGGQFTSSGAVATPFVARWDGLTWSSMGGGLNDAVEALAVLDTGELVAAGQFSGGPAVNAPRVARWNGSTWSPMGIGVLGTGWSRLAVLVPLPGGQLLLGGQFDNLNGVPANNLARWNGANWTSLPGTDGEIYVIAPLPGGAFAVGGEFATVGGAVSPYFAKLVTPCPASAIASGAGCTGSGGANVLAATALPWLGGTCRSLATGMPTNGLALAIVGFAPTSIPLAAILPQGVVGCSQLATLDLLDVLVPSAGRATATLAIPNSSALVGRTFHQQVVPLDLDALGNLVAVTATNALALTIGAL